MPVRWKDDRVKGMTRWAKRVQHCRDDKEREKLSTGRTQTKSNGVGMQGKGG